MIVVYTGAIGIIPVGGRCSGFLHPLINTGRIPREGLIAEINITRIPLEAVFFDTQADIPVSNRYTIPVPCNAIPAYRRTAYTQTKINTLQGVIFDVVTLYKAAGR